MSTDSSSSQDPAVHDGSSEAVHISDEYADALDAHYERFFGTSSRIVFHEKRSLGIHIDTYMYPPTEARPFTTAATVGMSALPLEEACVCENCKAAADGVPEHRAELLMYLDANWDYDDPLGKYPILMMTYIARTPHLLKHAFGLTMTYEFPPEVVPEGSLLTDGYVCLPAYENLAGDSWEEFGNFAFPDGQKCNIFWLIPITRAESYIKRTQGPGALNRILFGDDNDFFILDIDRQCYVEHENRAQRRARAKAQRNRAKRHPLTPVDELICADCGRHS
jgi:hypothetical protein